MHDIIGAGDKNSHGTFWYLSICPSIFFALHHSLLPCYTNLELLSYISNVVFAIYVGQCQELIPLPDAKWHSLSEKNILPTRTSERCPF